MSIDRLSLTTVSSWLQFNAIRSGARGSLYLGSFFLALTGAASSSAFARSESNEFLVARSGSQSITLPIESMDIELHVVGPLLRATVRQQFKNDGAAPLDATYRYPLPERAAVHSMTMWIGAREIVAEVKERGEARKQFEQAKSAGKKASLVEEERPNLFTTSVTNIGAGEEVSVELEYLEELHPLDRIWSASVPLAFTPRYCPHRYAAAESNPGPWIDGISAADTAPAGLRVTFSATIEMGAPIAELTSTTHRLTLERGSISKVTPDGGRLDPSRDLTFAWTLEQQSQPTATLFLEPGEDAQYGLLMMTPAADSAATGGLPTETVWILDISGSMAGRSIAQAQAALSTAVERLQSGDRFGLIAFSSDVTLYHPETEPVDARSKSDALGWIHGLRIEGGTNIDAALAAGIEMLSRSHGELEQRLVLITDGAVDNEAQLSERVRRQLGRARLHVIAIGDAPNRYLMRKLAETGHGFAQVIDGDELAQAAAEKFLARIDRPVLSDLELQFTGNSPRELYPAVLPDLYAGEPLVLALKFDGAAAPTAITIRGRSAGRAVSETSALVSRVAKESGLDVRWARSKVEALLDAAATGGDVGSLRQQVIELAIAHRLVTPFTSLIAVERHPSVDPSTRLDLQQEPLALPTTGTLSPLLSRLALALTIVGSLGLLLALRVRSA